jgi:homoserine acetyltransferase
MIPESFIQELLNRVDVVDVIDKSVPLKKAGSNYVACCPFHQEKSPSFTVSPTKQFYHCFGCGAHGSALSFLIEYQGMSFVERFDPNSYLYLTRAASYFDLTRGNTRAISDVFAGTSIRFLVVSFTSDWLYSSVESRNLVRALNAVAADVSYADIESDKGHDSFLLEVPELDDTLRGFLTARQFGNVA